MKKLIGFISCLLLANVAIASDCPYEEGDDFKTKGKYNWADTCSVTTTIEKVNSSCTKIKVNVDEIKGAWGLNMDVVCRFNNTQGAVGDQVWIRVE